MLYFSYVRHELAEPHPRMAVCFLYVGIACLFLGSTLTHMMVGVLSFVKEFCRTRIISAQPLYVGPHFLAAGGLLRHCYILSLGGRSTFRMPLVQLASVHLGMSFVKSYAPLNILFQSYLTSLVVVVLTQYLSTCALFLLKFSWKPRHAIRFLTCLILTVWLYIPLYDRYLTV